MTSPQAPFTNDLFTLNIGSMQYTVLCIQAYLTQPLELEKDKCDKGLMKGLECNDSIQR